YNRHGYNPPRLLWAPISKRSSTVSLQSGLRFDSGRHLGRNRQVRISISFVGLGRTEPGGDPDWFLTAENCSVTMRGAIDRRYVAPWQFSKKLMKPDLK